MALVRVTRPAALCESTTRISVRTSSPTIGEKRMLRYEGSSESRLGAAAKAAGSLTTGPPMPKLGKIRMLAARRPYEVVIASAGGSPPATTSQIWSSA